MKSIFCVVLVLVLSAPGTLLFFGEDGVGFDLDGSSVCVGVRIAFKIEDILLTFLGVPSKEGFGFGSGCKIANGTSS